MNIQYVVTFVVVLATIIAVINHRFLKLPTSIGVMLIAITVSVIIMLTSDIFPTLFDNTTKLITSVDFSNVFIGTVLNFLLFAGTIQIRVKDLRSQLLPVLLFSTLGVAVSSFAVAIIMYYVFPLLNLDIPFLQCLLFGTLISPTDPISVLAILRESKISRSLETKISGESLFNDGVALVLFFTILHALHNPGEGTSFAEISRIFVQEALGGLALGVALGFVGLRVLKSVSDYKIEVMITLAIVLGGYTLARSLQISEPLTMVAAGIFIGNYGKAYAMSDTSGDYMDKFWELIDEFLNIVLFVLMGFELLLITHFSNYWLAGLIAIPAVLIARFVSIYISSLIIRLQQEISIKTIGFLTWGGLRGGISIALALTLNEHHHGHLFVLTTYFVVVFSIVVQGLSIEKFAARRKNKAPAVEL
ncbi:MAG TPA: sodium:proton antiporter [Chitinophagaceae bacterium]|nr:sodium:proton antiporter [Chitinophagaceae bacterium]